MSTVRSFANNSQFVVTDLTNTLITIPNNWGLVNQLGIFRHVPVTQHTITVEKTDKTLAAIVDMARGSRNLVSKDGTRAIHAFAIPHFPLDDELLPSDLQGIRAYGMSDAVDTEAAAILRKVERMRLSHARLLETAKVKALVDGTVYAPNGTVSIDWYSSFGITRKNVDFVWGTQTTDLVAKAEEAIAHIQDNLKTGETVTDFVAICSPVFFAALVGHATMKEAYKYQDPDKLVLRLKTIGVDSRCRAFEMGGILWIEYRGTDVAGNLYVTSGEARIFPLGLSEAFETYFSPANKFGLVNTLGEEAYMWEYRSPKGDRIDFESEANHASMLRYPQVVVRAHSST